MKGRTLAIALLVALLGVVAFVFWLGATGGGTAGQSPAGSGGSGGSAGSNDAAERAARRIEKTIADRHVRDELRRRILAGWAAEGDDESSKAARAGHFVPRPNKSGTGIDPNYIQNVIRADFMPMAGKCYEELLARDPKASGKMVVNFTIAADDGLGGIVEEVSLDDTSTLKDEKLATCFRESMATVAFPPPAHDGVVTVTYPFVLHPDEPPDE